MQKCVCFIYQKVWGVMKSYEDAILDYQESEKDECTMCEFADTEKCKNQCMEIHSAYNPNLRR